MWQSWLSWWRRNRRLVRIVMWIASPVMAIACWLVIQHKPGWYAPARLDEAGRRLARRAATERADDFGDKLVRRRPFEIVLREDEVNEWLASAPDLWPQSEVAEVRDPAVRFESGTVRLGVLMDRKGWKAIVSVGVSVLLVDDGAGIELRLVDAYGGSFPIPLTALAWASASNDDPERNGDGAEEVAPAPVDALMGDLQSVDDLLDGVYRRNWFVWPNGNRPFSIGELHVEDGRLSMRILPR